MRLALFVAVVPAFFVASCSPVGPALCEKEFDCQTELEVSLEDDYKEVCGAAAEGQQNALRKNAEKQCEDLANANVALAGCELTLDCAQLAAERKGEGEDCQKFVDDVAAALDASNNGADCDGIAAVEDDAGGEGEGEAG